MIMEDEIVLEINEVSKSFPGVQALDKVSMKVYRHEIVGLVGENGAGKSTLLKILIGAYQPDEGEVMVRGKPVHLHSVKGATDYGLAMVFQEQSLLANMTVRENIYLGHEEVFTHYGMINWRKMDQEAHRQLEKVGLDLETGTPVYKLSFATRQMVELARVMALEDLTQHEPIVILDEPTTVLEKAEKELLFERVRSLKERASIIFVSHHLDEILELTDRVYVFKDGRNVAERKNARDNRRRAAPPDGGPGAKRRILPPEQAGKTNRGSFLKVENLCIGSMVKNISFELHRGEIIGFAGVLGSGREEVCRSVAGVVKIDSGTHLDQWQASADWISCRIHRSGCWLCTAGPRQRRFSVVYVHRPEYHLTRPEQCDATWFPAAG